MNILVYFSKLTILLFVIFSHSAIATAGEHILIPKLGFVDRDENTNHLVDTNRFDIEDDIVVSTGFTYLYQLDNGFAFGAEVFGYKNDIVTTTDNHGDIITTHLYGVIEKIFNTKGEFKPFIGFGLGAATMIFNATINGEIDDDYVDFATGFSYEIFTGAEVKINDKIGLMVEYKYFDLDINDDIGNKDINIETDGHAIFAGIAIHL